MDKKYIAIDLKSFYASVECAERGLDPLDANLVVADESRTEKTICLAVSPSLKSMGVSGRARLFEAVQRVREVNRERQRALHGRRFSGKSVFASELTADNSLEVDFIIARPRMAYYMSYSRNIVEIYLDFVSIDDILIYSVDEVFIDATNYLATYKKTAHEFAMMLIRQVLKETGITATAGIGTNMYLAKVAMDVVAKHMPPDADGVRIAELDEMSYREKLWCHTPITDFWRVGAGTARRLEKYGMFTMGDIARCSLGDAMQKHNAALLYKLFGVNAELLIDHAWGYEPCEIKDCKAYKPEAKSLSEGQVLPRPYSFDEGRIVAAEMADNLAMDLVRKGFVTDQIVLDVSYDTENVITPEKAKSYKGEIVTDRYGRQTPKPVHASVNLGRYTAASGRITEAVLTAYDRITDRGLTVRRFNVAVMHLLTPDEAKAKEPKYVQTDFFTDYDDEQRKNTEAKAHDEREMRMQKALLNLRSRFGKNSIVRGLNMQEGATAMDRNEQIGGHKA